ncbi:hypothetical protein GCM10010233_16930 [Streptomyces pseudogriseolus]|uniref:Lipoprotein n=1 Tax=Streptomyces pseudogriseolus TaxID=36817 RepID=A0ABQ2TF06_STREZ|nr:hypothetical protein GCM10010233_16930 [Streptomyces gancidicus]GGS66998.1 hypothetical protein GCM10010285_52670 [Streptomyces rubiginosus]
MTTEAAVEHFGPARARGGLSRRARWAVAAVGLAGALTLTACGGDGGSDDSAGTPTPSVTRTADSGGGTGGTGDTGGSDGAPAGDLQGSWLTTADGKAVVLMVNGEEAALFATGGTVCSGTTKGDSEPTITLKCPTGDGDRTKGTVTSVDGKSLTVTWDGAAGEETYTKAEGGSLPPGLPTEGLGS